MGEDVDSNLDNQTQDIPWYMKLHINSPIEKNDI